jgi:SAM-dependent methyltransferase
MERVIKRELLDDLPVGDPGAIGSRRDLQKLNRIMNHAGSLRGVLESGLHGRLPRRIVELGAGDGTLLLQLARRLSPRWPRVEATLVDGKNAVTDETLAAFAVLGWRVEVVTADVFDWLKKRDEPADAMICNLFLHHFSDKDLAEMLRLASTRSRLFAACEPRRACLPLFFSKLVWFIGCNAVTRHDAVASVCAGFTGQELSSLWPRNTPWRLREKRARWFTHIFSAEQVHGT